MSSAISMQTPACVLQICMTFPFLVSPSLHFAGALCIWHLHGSCEVAKVHSTPSVCGACLLWMYANGGLYCTTKTLHLLSFAHVMCPCLPCVSWHKSLVLFGSYQVVFLCRHHSGFGNHCAWSAETLGAVS